MKQIFHPCDDCESYREEIKELKDKVEELEEKYKDAYDHMAMQDGMTVSAKKHNALLAENKRLREALEWALKYGEFAVAVDNPIHAKALDRARAALKETGDD